MDLLSVNLKKNVLYELICYCTLIFCRHNLHISLYFLHVQIIIEYMNAKNKLFPQSCNFPALSIKEPVLNYIVNNFLVRIFIKEI
jgi:hypothetical protein